jgi:biopolymer transport protein ExbD
MKASKHVMRVRRHHARLRGRHDLNMVPMIDMMVILVFFLIFTAVFTKTNILELNLPSSETAPPLPPGLQLEVIVHKDKLEVADRNTGLLKSLPSAAAGYDFRGLGEYLWLVKAKFPQLQDATILLDPEIPYDVLVQAMDSVRVYEAPGGNYGRAELFPNISVGDAPR